MKPFYRIFTILVLACTVNACKDKEETPFDEYAYTRSLIVGEWHAKNYVANGISQLNWNYSGDTNTYLCKSGGNITCAKNRVIVHTMDYNFKESGSVIFHRHMESQTLDADTTIANCQCAYSVFTDNDQLQAGQWALDKNTGRLNLFIQPPLSYKVLALTGKNMHLQNTDSLMLEDIELEK